MSFERKQAIEILVELMGGLERAGETIAASYLSIAVDLLRGAHCVEGDIDTFV